ncbi:MAG: MbtH family protein [Thermoanaerobaculia bacterium]|nr:MbtH family protein [Thermoanaerobaculia bacterium]
MSAWDPDEEDTQIYKVVINHEEQYSIWPVDRENPLGWKDVGRSGTKQECLDYIEEVWTDMRPLSLRKKMEEEARRLAEEEKKRGDG